ncbi:MAG: SusC/RagA family TonB-linked outer membrane protein, partial [Tannerellaceae bacterium]
MKKLTFVLICLMLSVGLAFAQTTKVAGVVTSSEDGYPVIGASVVAKGTTQGTVTDIDGNFTIDVPSSVKTLIFSYVGMNTKEVPVKSVMNVVLDPASLDLEEVVVTGYGITKKAAFTGSAQTLKSEELVAKTDANFMKSLQGSVAGLQMNNRGGQPGAYASVNIRGIGSVNSGTEPLYVIDGMPYFSDKVGMNSGVGSGQQASSPLASINPADIESINVLKDATATSIYGARAANGVIVITTKKGKEGKPQVNLTAKAGVSKVFNLDHNYRTVNLDRYLDIWGKSVSESDPSKYPTTQAGIDYVKNRYGITENTKSVDWLEEVLRTGFTQEYNVDVQGGKEGLKYFVSAGYFDNEGVLIGTGMDRYSGRLNLEQTGKVVSFGVQASGSIANINNAPSESQYVNPIVAVYDL